MRSARTRHGCLSDGDIGGDCGARRAAGSRAGTERPHAAPARDSRRIRRRLRARSELGERYGNATVVRITDEEIVLQRPEATETIKLYSSVQRKKRWPAAQADAAGEQEEEDREAN